MMKKVRLALGVGLIASLCLALGGPSFAGKGQDKGKKEEPKRLKETKASQAVQNLALADKLIDYGIANKKPAALLVAAEILHNNPVKDDPKRVFKTEKIEKASKKERPRTAENVLAEAKKIAKALGTKQYNNMIEATAKLLEAEPRSPYPGGCVVRHGHIHGKESRYYHIHCHGHTHANLHPHFPNNNVDLDLYVYNRFGQYVTSDTSLSPCGHVHWNGDGDFRIRVYMYTRFGHCNYTLRVS